MLWTMNNQFNLLYLGLTQKNKFITDKIFLLFKMPLYLITYFPEYNLYGRRHDEACDVTLSQSTAIDAPTMEIAIEKFIDLANTSAPERTHIRTFLVNLVAQEYVTLPAWRHESGPDIWGEIYPEFDEIGIHDVEIDHSDVSNYISKYRNQLAVLIRKLLNVTPAWIKVTPLIVHNAYAVKSARRY